MTDGVVQVPVDSTGKKIDTSELTRADGQVVERQRIVLSSDALAGALALVRDGALHVEVRGINEALELLRDIKLGLELLTNQEIKR